jgi:hypothetical protein
MRVLLLMLLLACSLALNCTQTYMGKDCAGGELMGEFCQATDTDSCSPEVCRTETQYSGEKAYYNAIIETCPQSWPAHPGWVTLSYYDNCKKDTLKAIRFYPQNECTYSGYLRTKWHCENGKVAMETFSLSDEDCLHPIHTQSIPLNTCDSANETAKFVTCLYAPVWPFLSISLLGAVIMIVAVIVGTGKWSAFLNYLRQKRRIEGTANHLESPEMMQDMADDTFDAELSDNDFS